MNQEYKQYLRKSSKMYIFVSLLTTLMWATIFLAWHVIAIAYNQTSMVDMTKLKPSEEF